MALAEVRWFSRTLSKQVGSLVILPDAGKPPFPVFYLLHGLSDDHTIWLRRTRIEVYAAKYPMVVVMPDGFRGFYTDNEEGPAYGQYMAEELPAFIERNFPVASRRTARCIGGLSMGGYGAFRQALARPDLYVSATSHSGALLAGSEKPKNPEFKRIFGARPHGSIHDLIALARRARKSGPLPRLRLDCGTEDFLLDHNRAFHRELTAMKIPHEYQEFPGSHEWGYWNAHVQEALAFHARAMRLKPL